MVARGFFRIGLCLRTPERASANKDRLLPQFDSRERVVAFFEVLMIVSVRLLPERAKGTDRVGLRYDG